MWPQFAEQADKEGWPAARFLAAIAEHELAERDRRRIERHLAEARLLPGKTLDTFEFEAVPMISKAQVMGHQRPLRAALDAHHRQPALRRMGGKSSRIPQ